MLTLGPGSVCDICLEAFGTGHKAASAIVCGHVFCSECIDQLKLAPPTTNHPDPNYKPCPLCRYTFDTRTCIRLHVDHDNNARSTVRTATEPTVSEEDVHTVQSLLERMINIANEGSSEEESRQCIAEAKTFLQGQKDSKQFIELRTCSRMLVYTTKVRATNRQLQAQKTELEASLSRVREEKAEVERKARDERDLALSIEKSLQDHAKLTQEGYAAMIMHYNRIVADLSTICEHLRHSHCDDSYSRDHKSTRELASHIAQGLTSYHDEYIKRDGHVVTEPGNLTVSPLAAYSALPTRPFILPEEGEIEMPPPKSKRRSQSSTCCNPEHPADYDCSVLCTETSQPTHQTSAFRSRSATPNDRLVSSGSERGPVHADRNAPSLVAQIGCEVVGIQSTDDHNDHRSTIHRNAEHNCDPTVHNYDQPTLSHEENQPSPSLHTPGSIPRPHNRGSVSGNETASLARTAPLATASSPQVHSSPSHISGSTSRSQRRGSIPKQKTPDAETTPLATTSESPSTQGFRNLMLQDLLQDAAPFSGSSSQINVPSSSTQSPAALCHDSHRSDQKTEPSLGYYTLPQPSPSLLAERRERQRQESLRKSENRDTQSEEIFIPPLVPTPSQVTQSHDQARVPVLTYDPSNVLLSSASSAARAKARERAEKAEKEKRTEKDRDSIRKKAEGEERRKAKRAEAGYLEYENFTLSYPGMNSSSSKSKRPSDSCGVTDGSQQGSLSYISSHDPPPYTSASQRASGSGSKGNRYTEKYAIGSYGHKYIPVHVLSATPRA